VVARFNDSVSDLKDLQPGMVLEGTVSNVAQFGAFVDLGVHQDGLVHVSQMSHKFVNDAREVVKTGSAVKVRVLEVDLARKRISLTMKLDAPMPSREAKDNRFQPAARGERQRGEQRGAGAAGQGGAPAAGQGAMAAAFAKLQGRR
jgi:protein Tex